ncbi:Topoisomerase 1-associated factor 1 [Gnomoniopsis smithogilvyi]|uniref:Topoisomerase 1-associated factor 1 n=1 Tax=Gnomoniopsis smithogilvyi TaxID=1191159 RepID=A0A9W9CW30_9PEZI|nr:Topoisomerase 1-associated factor 1 [Gnomoniopsis smithogilvyi]
MESAISREDVVHPEVRAHINSLVSALGGFNDEDDGTYYRLGDDALDVLRDIKKWIRFYDEKTNRMDVARCLADANLVTGDLIHILALWTENTTDDKYKSRIALACYELLAPLTWPIEKNRETMTVNHHRHVPVLELEQLKYKREIINFDKARLLHTAIRVALPSMAIPIGDRVQRDVGIIKLVLYFLRNIAMIAPPPGTKIDGDESQISRSATIDAFSYQDVFFTILTLASNMGEDFKTEDVIVMEIIFHIIKRVDVKKLFLDEKELGKARTAELAAAMKKEASMLRSYNRKAPTRHSRFGTMLWIQKSDGKVASLSGQGALADVSARERKMDESKTFRAPRRAAKEDMEPKDLGPPVVLNARANKQLREFVEEFLDSGFNPLFQQVRKTLERDGVDIMQHHAQQFFYTVAWFLQAERTRQSTRAKKSTSEEQISSFQLVATVLNQEMFILVKRYLVKSYTDGDWRELNAVMRCFTQILLTVQEMFTSENEEDQEIAENALSRIFYEETTHDAVVNVVRSYKDQGFDYLDACTELVHTYMRVLEAYSKENVDMQVRSKRRSKKKKKKAQQAADAENGETTVPSDEDDSENDQAAAEKTAQERKFDFKKFANRFVPQGVVDTFIKFTKYYRDLDESQLKRVHRYFYRLAFKQEMSVMLFRVDIIHLLYNMIKGPEPLDKNLGIYKEWEELVKQIIRRCVKKIEDRPALIIELLFSKINATAYYLEYGYDRQTISTAIPRAAADLEFKRLDLMLEEQIGVAVTLLLDKNEQEHIDWVKAQLSACSGERRSWEALERARLSIEGPDGILKLPDNWEAMQKEPEVFVLRTGDDGRKTAIFKNPRLRLLMKVVGFERLSHALDEEVGSAWIIPPRHSAQDLEEYRDLISKAEFSPLSFEDGETAEQQVRRKTAPRRKVVYDDDDEEDANNFVDDDDDALFPKNLPNKKLVGPDGDRPTKKRRIRRRKDNSEDDEDELSSEEDEEIRAEKARRRRKRDLDKQRKIKSALYISPSDDESDAEGDAEFFRREEEIRQRVKKALAFAPTDVSQLQESVVPSAAIAETMKRLMADSEDEGAKSSADESSSNAKAASRKRKSDAILTDDDEDEQMSPPPTKKAAPAPKRRGGFLVESSDEEDEVMNDAESSSLNHVTDDGDDAKTRDDSDGDEMQTDDTPLSSNPKAVAQDEDLLQVRSPLKERDVNTAQQHGLDSEGEEDDVPVATKRRPRTNVGVVMDDSDDD